MSQPTDRELLEAQAALEAENDFADDDFTHFREIDYTPETDRTEHDVAYHAAFVRCQVVADAADL